MTNDELIALEKKEYLIERALILFNYLFCFLMMFLSFVIYTNLQQPLVFIIYYLLLALVIFNNVISNRWLKNAEQEH